MTTVEEFAAAKINLTLHVTGRRSDGYHLLDSLVVFADVGDRVTASPAAGLSLQVNGPQAAGVPADGDNLVLRAAAMMSGPGAALLLAKRLPPASGIGGGSADAAATLRALARLWNAELPAEKDLLRLGADVPVCLAGRAVRMSGIGEILSPLPVLPLVHAVLVNPRVPLSTPAVFRALSRRDNARMPEMPPSFGDLRMLASWLAIQRNDLEAPALQIAPAIGKVLSALRMPEDCLMARMSGSGATCFGLFPDAAAATAAAGAIEAAHPDWWVAPTRLG